MAERLKMTPPSGPAKELWRVPGWMCCGEQGGGMSWFDSLCSLTTILSGVEGSPHAGRHRWHHGLCPGGSTRTALITGATTGIGYELARCFAQDGFDLVLVARTERELARVAEELRAAHGVSATALANDLSRPAAVEEIASALERQGLAIDVLVNNAGFGAYGPFAAADLAIQLEMIQVNLVALTQLTKRMLGGMLKRGEGKILNVASTAAFQPGPLMAVYYATKAYVLSFSEALANELQGSGVSVTALCPGPTRSEFLNRAGMQRSNLFRGRLMEADEVARIGYRGMMQGKAVVIPGMRNRLLALSVRCVPRRVVTAVVRKFQESR